MRTPAQNSLIRRAATLGEAQGTWLQTAIPVLFGGAPNTEKEYFSPAKKCWGAVLTRAMNASHHQQGALFGLDARIALAIFSILSVVAGVAVVISIDSTRGQVLATELADTGQAIESYHHDLKTDIFLTLITPSGKNAFQALYDNAVISENDNLRSRWNGPYIKFTSNINSRYGEMLLTKAGPDHTQPCDQENICYLYLVYGQVKKDIANGANKVLDGDGEANADKSGRLQWTQNADDAVSLYFRATTALSQNMDY